MNNELTFLITLCVVIAALGVIASMVIMRKQQQQEFDKGVSRTTVKNPIIGNPILYAYLLFPVAIIIFIAIVVYMFMR